MPKEENKIEIFEGAISKIEKSQDTNTVADKYLKEIIYVKNDIGLRFIYLGQLLYNVQEQELYKNYADSYAEYVAMPEINMKLSTADNFKRVYKTFVKDWKIDPSTLADVGVSKCVALLERTDINAKTADEWLAKALTLSHRDLMIECGADEAREFGGIINIEVFSDDDGLIMNVQSAPPEIPLGLYRITKDGAVGTPKRLAYLRGRKTDG